MKCVKSIAFVVSPFRVQICRQRQKLNYYDFFISLDEESWLLYLVWKHWPSGSENHCGKNKIDSCQKGVSHRLPSSYWWIRTKKGGDVLCTGREQLPLSVCPCVCWRCLLTPITPTQPRSCAGWPKSTIRPATSTLKMELLLLRLLPGAIPAQQQSVRSP